MTVCRTTNCEFPHLLKNTPLLKHLQESWRKDPACGRIRLYPAHLSMGDSACRTGDSFSFNFTAVPPASVPGGPIPWLPIPDTHLQTEIVPFLPSKISSHQSSCYHHYSILAYAIHQELKQPARNQFTARYSLFHPKSALHTSCLLFYVGQEKRVLNFVSLTSFDSFKISVLPHQKGKKKKAILNIALWKKTYVRQANENRTFQWLLHKTRHMYLERHMRIAHSLHSCATQNSHSKARLTMPHAFRIMWTHTGCQIIWAHTSTKKNTTNLSYLHPLQNKLYYLIQTTIEIHSYSF